MRLYNYLNEKVDDKIKSAIEPFLKEFRSVLEQETDQLIWRGHNKVSTTHYTVKNVHKNRKPRFIPEELHEYLGKVSKELWGWNIRSEGAFTGDERTALSFGKRFIFIPMGNYQYVWAYGPTKRAVYSLYDDYGITKNSDLYSEQEKSENLEIIRKHIVDMYRKKYSSKELPKYLTRTANPTFEAIFNCDKYILVHPDYWSEFKQKLGIG